MKATVFTQRRECNGEVTVADGEETLRLAGLRRLAQGGSHQRAIFGNQAGIECV
jgi:hypothetical protein